MELQRRGLVLGLLAAPFVIRTPGLLMPVSARAVPKSRCYPRSVSQVLTLSMITKELTKRLSELLPSAVDAPVVSGPGPNQSYVELDISTADMAQCMSIFGPLFIEPAAFAMASHLRGRRVSPVGLELPHGVNMAAMERYAGVAVRGLRAYDINDDRFITRFDLTHS